LLDALGEFLFYSKSKPNLSKVIGMKVLVAEGQTKVRYALRVLLKEQSWLEEVDEATDACSFFKNIQVSCPDLVLLDWDLPGMVINKVMLKLKENYHRLPVIVLSERPEVQKAALAAGGDAFFWKSYPPERLLAVIQDCIKVSNQEIQTTSFANTEKGEKGNE
jgi:DNA-binding NarL/FixJ family response regulator